jgi:hypothetical protein
MNNTHNNLITAAARKHLAPLGGVQEGRSRLWLIDSGWFASVVEFQPSSFGKGSYLNVGAHFLWSPANVITFDFGYRKDGFHEFNDESEFADVADSLARLAAQETLALQSRFPTPKVLHGMTPGNTGEAWIDRFHRGVSHALDSQPEQADFIFDTLLNPKSEKQADPAYDEYARLRTLLHDLPAFKRRIGEIIGERRAELKLPSNDEPLASAP